MSINIVVSDKLTFQVKGAFRKEDGAEGAFDFEIIATRLKGPALQELLSSKESAVSIADKLRELVTGWKGVKGPEGQVEYSPERLQDLLDEYPALPGLIWQRYLSEVAVRAKN